jgi:hypothetical protein
MRHLRPTLPLRSPRRPSRERCRKTRPEYTTNVSSGVRKSVYQPFPRLDRLSAAPRLIGDL